MLRRFRIMIMNHLGFSIKEANGTLVLILILCIFIFIPPFFNSFDTVQRVKFESDPSEILKWKKEFELVEKKSLDNKKLSKVDLTSFDPNTISKEKWIDFGVSPALARRIMNYRNAGGTFKKNSDLLKIYGMDSTTAAILMPYLTIKPELQKAKSNQLKTKVKSKKVTITIKTKRNINLATEEEFRKIYGIGERLSKRIVNYRSLLGGYHSLSQLSEVYFLEDSLLPKINNAFAFDGLVLSPLKINSDSVQVLRSHPYLNRNQAKAIVSYREVHGKFQSPEGLMTIKIISDSTFEKLKPYISVKE